MWAFDQLHYLSPTREGHEVKQWFKSRISGTARALTLRPSVLIRSLLGPKLPQHKASSTVITTLLRPLLHLFFPKSPKNSHKHLLPPPMVSSLRSKSSYHICNISRSMYSSLDVPSYPAMAFLVSVLSRVLPKALITGWLKLVGVCVLRRRGAARCLDDEWCVYFLFAMKKRGALEE